MPSDDPERPVTPQERMFLTRYALTGNLVDSYRNAGFSQYAARQKAQALLRKPNIKRAYEEIISRPLDEVQASIVRVVRETAHVAFSDIGDIFDEEGNVLPVHEMPEHARRAVASMKVTRNYRRNRDGESDLEVTREVKLWPKTTALEMFLKYHEKIQQVFDEELGLGSKEKKEFTLERLLAEAAQIGLLKADSKDGGNGSGQDTLEEAGGSGQASELTGD